MSDEHSVPEETRQVAARRVRYNLGEAKSVLAVGPLLIGFGALLLAAGTDEPGFVWGLIGLGVLVTLLGLVRVIRNHRALSIARRGVLRQARVRKIHRRPGGREGDPNEYSLALELPSAEPRPVVYMRALIPPEQAVKMFGFEPKSMVPVEPDDLQLPVLMLPEQHPGKAVLAT